MRGNAFQIYGSTIGDSRVWEEWWGLSCKDIDSRKQTSCSPLQLIMLPLLFYREELGNRCWNLVWPLCCIPETNMTKGWISYLIGKKQNIYMLKSRTFFYQQSWCGWPKFIHFISIDMCCPCIPLVNKHFPSLTSPFPVIWSLGLHFASQLPLFFLPASTPQNVMSFKVLAKVTFPDILPTVL